MRHLRVHGDEKKWHAKLVEEYNIDDKYHKHAMAALIKEVKELAVVRNYFIDRDTLLKLYDQSIEKTYEFKRKASA